MDGTDRCRSRAQRRTYVDRIQCETAATGGHRCGDHWISEPRPVEELRTLVREKSDAHGDGKYPSGVHQSVSCSRRAVTGTAASESRGLGSWGLDNLTEVVYNPVYVVISNCPLSLVYGVRGELEVRGAQPARIEITKSKPGAGNQPVSGAA